MKKYFEDLKIMYGFKKIIKTSIIIIMLVIFLDITNAFTKIINNCHSNWWLLSLFVLFFCCSMISTKFIKMVKLKSINYWDFCLSTLILSCIVLNFYINYCTTESYKNYLLLCCILVVVTFFVIRLCFYNSKTENETNNVIDLKELHKKRHNLSKENLILLEETAVDYDLLHREEIIGVLYDTILKCHPKNNFTIGLNGKWGSGKTTIINNVISRIETNGIKDSFVIVKFDPWDYDNEKSLLKGLIDEIFYNMGIDYDMESINHMIESLIDVIFYNAKNSFNKIIKINSNSTKDKIKVENIINDYLKKHNKRLLLIVDNLDRVDCDKSNFIIRCIESILELKSTICILLYDELILDNSFKKRFCWEDERVNYMEKIVQLKIDVPLMDESSLKKVIDKISNNIVFDNNVKLSTILGDENEFKDIRELKRFLNNIFVSFKGMSKKINNHDLLKLEYIRLNNPKLYYDIWEHKTYFISDDRQYDTNLFMINYDEYNTKAKEFFKQFFENKEYQKQKELLKSLFPNVDNYFENLNIINTSGRNKEEYQKGIRECRIYNARYFDLYFTKSSNVFIRINNDVDTLINKKNSLRIKKNLSHIISNYDIEELKVFMEVLEINFGKIDKNNYLILALDLLKSVNDIHYRPIFLGVDARTRCELIIAKLLSYLTVEEMEKFCKKISSNYSNIYTLHMILQYMKKENENINNDNDNYNILSNKFKEICKIIINKNINLYSDKYYVYANIWGLYHYNKEEVIKYVKKNVNERNIFKFLNDLITHSVGSNGYGYHIKQHNIEALGPGVNIKKLIKLHNKELTDDQTFLKKIFELYVKSFNKEIHENEVYQIEYKNIEDI